MQLDDFLKRGTDRQRGAGASCPLCAHSHLLDFTREQLACSGCGSIITVKGLIASAQRSLDERKAELRAQRERELLER